MISQMVVFIPAAVVFAASPGAGNILAMRNGARYGARAAILGFAGRFASFLILFLAVAIGLGTIIAASATALTVIKWCGVTYLVWLGVQTLWAHRRPVSSAPSTTSISGGDPTVATGAPSPVDDEARATTERTSVARVARQEFLTSITNPKALLLVSAFLPQFVSPNVAAPLQLAVLGGIYIALEFVAACGWARLGHVLSSDRLTAAARRRFGQLTGVLMLVTAGWLASFSARAA